MARSLADLVLSRRRSWFLAFAILTLFLAFKAGRLEIDTSYDKHLPRDHPYTATLLHHRDDFGSANRLLIAVRSRSGDIFQPTYFETFRRINDAVFFLPGVDRSTVRSFVMPNVRYFEIIEGGFTGGNVVPADFEPTPEQIEAVRANVLKSGIVGRLVANDFSAALIVADLLERTSGAGSQLDYRELAEMIDQTIRAPFTSVHTDIHVIGFAQAVGDIADGALQVVVFFGFSFFLIAILILQQIRNLWFAILPLGCSFLAVIWTLGTLPLFGFGLDPYSILVPFLIFAIGVSHGIQIVINFEKDYSIGEQAQVASRRVLERLLIPGGVAIISDTIGFLTLLLIDIPIIKEFGITSTVGIFYLLLTNLILIPTLLSIGPVRPNRRSNRRYRRSWHGLACSADPKRAGLIAGVSFVFLAVAGLEARNVVVGDLETGVPELRPDSRYNQDARVIAERFDIGVDLFQVIIETHADACVDHDIMAEIDRFDWHMQNVEGVQSTLSLPQVAKLINQGFNEGSPSWHTLPREPLVLAQAVSPIETSSGLLNADCSVMPVQIFTVDHRATTIDRVVEAATRYMPAIDPGRLDIRLASGNLGVMAATNDVVRAAQLPMLLGIYAAVTVLTVITFRSVRAAFCIVMPLAVVSVALSAVMSLAGIGLKISTLPVAVLGVGIGVDYGIYIYARLASFLERGYRPVAAYRRTLEVTGNAVLVTGLTLAFGVGTWVFSPLQFQADMGLLLVFMFLGNMVGALMLLPALAALVHGFGRSA